MHDQEDTIVADAEVSTADGTTGAGSETGHPSGKEDGGKPSGKSGKRHSAETKAIDETPDKPDAEPITEARIGELIRQSIAAYAAEQKKAQDEAEKLSTMNAQQRAEYERDSYRDELEALQHEVAVAKMQSTARAMLSEKGIHVPDKLIAAIVTDSADTTKENVEEFAGMYLDAVDAAVREKLRSETPKSGKTAPKMTKEQIFAIKDNVERVKAIQENMELFN